MASEVNPSQTLMNYYLEEQRQLPTSQSQQNEFSSGRDSKRLEIQQTFDQLARQTKDENMILHQVSKDVEQILSEEVLPTSFFPDIIFKRHYQNDEEKRALERSELELVTAMTDVERINSVLKDGYSRWVHQFTKQARIADTLIKENSILRKGIAQRNKEVVKLVNMLGSIESEQVAEIHLEINGMREEWNVLQQHYGEIREQITKVKKQQETIRKAFQTSQEQLKKTILDSNESQMLEEHYAKTLNLLQNMHDQAHVSQSQTKEELKRLNEMKTNLLKENLTIKEEIEKQEIEENSIEVQLKTRFDSQQDEKNRYHTEIDKLTERIQTSKAKYKQIRKELDNIYGKTADYQFQTKQIQKRMTESETMLKKMKQQIKKAISDTSQAEADLGLVNFETETLKFQSNSLQAQLNTLDDKQDQSLTQASDNQDGKLEMYRQELLMGQLAFSRQRTTLESQIAFKRNETKKWLSQIEQKKEDVDDLMKRIEAVTKNQAKLIQLKKKASELGISE